MTVSVKYLEHITVDMALQGDKNRVRDFLFERGYSQDDIVGEVERDSEEGCVYVQFDREMTYENTEETMRDLAESRNFGIRILSKSSNSYALY